MAVSKTGHIEGAEMTTTKNLKPGMIVRAAGIDSFGLDLTQFRKVTEIRRGCLYGDWSITFSDGVTAYTAAIREFEVSDAHKLPTTLDVIASVLGAYAAA